ncbi:MAG: 2-oxoacid:acceptor oxidoreductase subunit alpha [Tindallia sp. MSAO_Bac2]|nr:MAG: 2-oxoacid:acceptor oxidoreductase subunit alpha [Tindallia sp. MSAO_Bac2]
MMEKFTMLIGGIQGEGVVSTGISLMKALSRKGYYTLCERKFSSRIKGGNTHIIITVSEEEVTCVESTYHVIMAMDQESIDLNFHQLRQDGILFYDQELQVSENLSGNKKVIPLPITETAKDQGKSFMKNTSVIGFLGKMTGFAYDELEEIIKNAYGKKGQETLTQNLAVLKVAYNNDSFDSTMAPSFQHKKGKAKMMMMGNEAIALGAVMAGCRFMAGYPITPASDIMENLALYFPQIGGKTVQTEDEVAAIAMTVGASHAGARSMTATSGPGMTLMGEGLGLAGMIETPIVVVDAQRAGPSTGMPTKTEQSDLSFLYYAGHGEYSSIILSPSTVTECYEMTVEAFNLADQYQCPVIILTDLNLSLSPQTIDAIPFENPPIQRGLFASETFLSSYKDGGFPRYKITENGLSERALPGIPGGQHQVTGLEHNELGRPSDNPDNRKKMMKKRMLKTEPLKNRNEIIVEDQLNGKTLFMAYGSVYGVLKEASKRSESDVDIARIRQIKPLPVDQIKKLMAQYDSIVVVEENFNGQLAQIIRQETDRTSDIVSLTRYDGNNFTIEEILDEMERWCK